MPRKQEQSLIMQGPPAEIRSSKRQGKKSTNTVSRIKFFDNQKVINCRFSIQECLEEKAEERLEVKTHFFQKKTEYSFSSAGQLLHCES